MSYSDAVKSGGPIGASKVPPVQSVNSTSSPNGKVEVVPEEKLKEFEPKKEDNDKSRVHDFSKDIEKAKKEAKKAGEESSAFFKSLFDKLSKGFAQAGESIQKIGLKTGESGKSLAVATANELKNPVVVTQVLVGLGGVVGGYFAYLERHRIDTSNKVTLALHGAIVTGLVALDTYLFSKYYPKYK